MKITDTDGRSIEYLAFSLDAGAETGPFVIRATPDAGDVFRATPDANVSVMGRRAGTGDAFQDVATGPLDLAAYVGGTLELELKVVASPAVVGRVRVFLFVGSAKSGRAGYLT